MIAVAKARDTFEPFLHQVKCLAFSLYALRFGIFSSVLLLKLTVYNNTGGLLFT